MSGTPDLKELFYRKWNCNVVESGFSAASRCHRARTGTKTRKRVEW